MAAKLSPQETEYFKRYSAAVNKYMRDTQVDLTVDVDPPKHMMVLVRVLEDCGEVLTYRGSVLLKKDDTLLLQRKDVEPLIRQGKVLELRGVQ